MTVSLSLLIPDDKNDFIKFLITDVVWLWRVTVHYGEYCQTRHVSHVSHVSD